MTKPTIREALDHLREHFGLSMTEVLELVRTPVNPKDMRDEFAAHALCGLMADLPKPMYRLNWQENVAQSAYQLADAMLAERAK